MKVNRSNRKNNSFYTTREVHLFLMCHRYRKFDYYFYKGIASGMGVQFMYLIYSLKGVLLHLFTIETNIVDNKR